MKNISRRKAILMGIFSTGLIVSERENTMAWPPGPNENLKRDLTLGKTPVRLGSYLGISEKISPEEQIKNLSAKGFKGVIAAGSGESWYSLKDSVLMEYLSALKKYDVAVFEVGGYTNMIHPDLSVREKNLKHLCITLEAAEKLGCPMVGTISGSCDPVNDFNVHPDNWTEKTWKILVDSVKKVLKDTAGFKAALGMEAQITTNLDGPRAHKRLNDDVSDVRCAVNLDVTNMVSLANYYHTTELINECFDLLGESILGCHAKDTYVWPDKQTVHVQEVCPGQGVMDYEMLLVRLSRMKWPRTLLPEHIKDDEFPQAYEYIRKVAAKTGVKIYQ